MKRKTGTIIQAVCAVIFIICAACIGKYYYDSHTAEKSMSELRQTVEEADGEERAQNGMLSAYYDLYTQNSDMAGWIKIAGTDIDYPVMQSGDNEFYLHKSFEKEYQYCGLPFADFQCDVDKPSDNIIIYAHNMKDGSMFAALTKYADGEFLGSHGIIEFDTLYERRKYEVLCAFKTKASGKKEIKYHEFIDAGNQEDFYEFIETVRAAAISDSGKTAEYGDKLLTLSTCSYNFSDERFAVLAREIKD